MTRHRIPDRPDVGRGRPQPLIHSNISASIQFDTGFVEADPGSVWNVPCWDHVAALALLLSGASFP
jgi:hypothetical protein